MHPTRRQIFTGKPDSTISETFSYLPLITFVTFPLSKIWYRQSSEIPHASSRWALTSAERGLSLHDGGKGRGCMMNIYIVFYAEFVDLTQLCDLVKFFLSLCVTLLSLYILYDSDIFSLIPFQHLWGTYLNLSNKFSPVACQNSMFVILLCDLTLPWVDMKFQFPCVRFSFFF